MLVIVPLLSLTVDQMAKIRVALQVEVSIEAHHLDEISASLLRELIIPRMHKIGYDSTSTMFLFTSPQKLVTTPSLLVALVCDSALVDGATVESFIQCEQ